MRKRGAQAALSVLHLSRCPEHRSALSPILTSWLGSYSARLDFTKFSAPDPGARASYLCLAQNQHWFNNRLQRHLSLCVSSSSHWNAKLAGFCSQQWERGSSVSYPRQLPSRVRRGRPATSNVVVADSPGLGEGVMLSTHAGASATESTREEVSAAVSRGALSNRVEEARQLGWRTVWADLDGGNEIIGRWLAVM